ncbi:OLC1v1016708C1 [Oldenlandia corymbosa var. corymbosa]|uniref:OLC1v1016708C1 n=1 Tax=Oldenlandia corymbosa var. corymbosa TaxID=529605 RepID=A0AAV1E7R8_OLDCO|nr:OLC1v1016708C1 [Oldenlandia corymbosa var. corymbosa]
MLQNATCTLSNLCRGKPRPDFEKTKLALPYLARLVHSNDKEVLTDTCWALSYLSEGSHDNIQAVIDAGVCPRLVELLLCGNTSIMFLALRTIGNIVTGDCMQTQVIVDIHQALPSILKLLALYPNNKSIKKEACWAISNITAGSEEKIQAVIRAGFIGPLAQLC